MGLLSKGNCITFLVLGSLICAFSFNLVVLGSCEYLEASPIANVQLLQMGVFRYSLDLPGSFFNTNGECVTYKSDTDDAAIRTAQVCAVLAPIFGLVLILLIFVNQCCRPIPCSGIIISISYVGAQICTALIWLVYRADVCNIPDIGCDWSTAANTNLLAQIMYLVAAILHRCMPSPKEAAAVRKADKAENEAKTAQDEAKEANERADAAEKKVEEMEKANTEEMEKANTGLADDQAQAAD